MLLHVQLVIHTLASYWLSAISAKTHFNITARVCVCARALFALVLGFLFKWHVHMLRILFGCMHKGCMCWMCWMCTFYVLVHNACSHPYFVDVLKAFSVLFMEISPTITTITYCVQRFSCQFRFIVHLSAVPTIERMNWLRCVYTFSSTQNNILSRFIHFGRSERFWFERVLVSRTNARIQNAHKYGKNRHHFHRTNILISSTNANNTNQTFTFRHRSRTQNRQR